MRIIKVGASILLFQAVNEKCEGCFRFKTHLESLQSQENEF